MYAAVFTWNTGDGDLQLQYDDHFNTAVQEGYRLIVIEVGGTGSAVSMVYQQTNSTTNTGDLSTSWTDYITLTRAAAADDNGDDMLVVACGACAVDSAVKNYEMRVTADDVLLDNLAASEHPSEEGEDTDNEGHQFFLGKYVADGAATVVAMEVRDDASTTQNNWSSGNLLVINLTKSFGHYLIDTPANEARVTGTATVAQIASHTPNAGNYLLWGFAVTDVDATGANDDLFEVTENTASPDFSYDFIGGGGRIGNVSDASNRVAMSAAIVGDPAGTSVPTLRASADTATGNWVAPILFWIWLDDQPPDQDITPALVSQSTTAFAPTVTPGSVDISPAKVNQLVASFAPTVTPGAVDISPALVTQSVTSFAPSILGIADIAPALVSSLVSTFAPTVSPGPVDVSPALVSQPATAFAPSFSIDIPVGFTQQLTVAFDPVEVANSAIPIGPVDLVTQLVVAFAPQLNLEVTPGLTQQLTAAFDPALAIDIAPALVSQPPVAHSPTVAPGPVDVSPAFVTQTATAFAPSFSVNISAGFIDQSISAFDPLLTQLLSDLEGYRWRDDDGDEAGATWLAPQDSSISVEQGTRVRLRMLVDWEDDPPSGDYKLQYRRVGGGDWRDV
jgi:hypothetical protein